MENKCIFTEPSLGGTWAHCVSGKTYYSSAQQVIGFVLLRNVSMLAKCLLFRHIFKTLRETSRSNKSHKFLINRRETTEYLNTTSQGKISQNTFLEKKSRKKEKQ